MSPALFLPSTEAGSFAATELARGPWDPEAQHGGAPAALLVGALEGLLEPAGLPLVRVTFELLPPVPLGELRREAEGLYGRGAAARLRGENSVYNTPVVTWAAAAPPAGKGIAREARSGVAEGGIAIGETRLFDRGGLVGRGVQALLVAPRPS